VGTRNGLISIAVLSLTFACGGGAGRAEAPRARGCPADTVEIAGVKGALCVDRAEVTLGAYLECVGKAECTSPGEGRGCNKDTLEGQAQPVNCVDLKQAESFCASRGARLPTDAEWSAVAAGAKRDHEGACSSIGLPRQGTCSTARRDVDDDGRGLLDLHGNVAEWTSSGDERSRVARGGSWQATSAVELGVEARRAVSEGTRHPALGLRCVRER